MTIFAGKAFYIPLGSATALEDLSHMLSGNKPSSENELDDMCAKVKIKAFKSVIEGYDGRFLVVDCPMISKGMQDCSPSPNTEDPARHKDGMQYVFVSLFLSGLSGRRMIYIIILLPS